jgi:lipopolysaccharide export system permease protein
LIFDIQNTKISAILTPGVYSKELDGYAIKVDKGVKNSFEGILIHDHTNPNEIKTIRAEKGKIYKSDNGKYLFFELNKGFVVEELSPQAPSFTPNGKIHRNTSNSRPSRRSDFEQATYKIDLSGFSLKRSQDELFADKHEMLNVFQIYHEIDSVKISGRAIVANFLESLKNDHPYFQAKDYKIDSINTVNLAAIDSLPSETIVFDKLSNFDQFQAINSAQVKLRRKNENLSGQKEYLLGIERDINQYWIEFHRKFALTFTIIVLFFIGAPLGAIVRKGGFGAPVVIAALLFMIYFVLISIGDSLASSQVVSPFIGMWFASMILAPVAFILMRAAANDSPVFNKERWVKQLQRFKRKNESSLHHK